MTRLPRLLPVALIAVLLTVQAAEPTAPPTGPTYKIVGPDGRITFSDRKPTDATAHTRELGQTVTAPLLAPAVGAFDLHPSSAPPPARSYGGDAPPVDVGGRPFPPGLPEAVLDVLIHQFFVQTLVETCNRAQPGYAERYQTMVFHWRERNAEILAKSSRILFSRFTGEQRDYIRANGRARLAQLLPPPDAAPQDKINWCNRMSGDLVLRQFELAGDMRVAPILYFQPQ